jgi:hypothetical protein
MFSPLLRISSTKINYANNLFSLKSENPLVLLYPMFSIKPKSNWYIGRPLIRWTRNLKWYAYTRWRSWQEWWVLDAVAGHFSDRPVVENYPTSIQTNEPAANTGALYRYQLRNYMISCSKCLWSLAKHWEIFIILWSTKNLPKKSWFFICLNILKHLPLFRSRKPKIRP